MAQQAESPARSARQSVPAQSLSLDHRRWERLTCKNAPLVRIAALSLRLSKAEWRVRSKDSHLSTLGNHGSSTQRGSMLQVVGNVRAAFADRDDVVCHRRLRHPTDLQTGHIGLVPMDLARRSVAYTAGTLGTLPYVACPRWSSYCLPPWRLETVFSQNSGAPP